MCHAAHLQARRSWQSAAAGLCALVALTQFVLAAETRLEWFGRPFRYVVINQDLRGILSEFGRHVGVPVIVSDKVAGRVRGEIARASADKPLSAGEFLTSLAESNALTWYFDGSVLYLSADHEFSTQIIDVGNLKPQAVIDEMRRLSLMDDRFSIRGAGSAGMISVSGPPAFIAIVRQLVEKMRPPAPIAGDDPRVRIFRGSAPAEIVRVQRDARSVQRSQNAAK